jgi:hypothetical protein
VADECFSSRGGGWFGFNALSLTDQGPLLRVKRERDGRSYCDAVQKITLIRLVICFMLVVCAVFGVPLKVVFTVCYCSTERND